MLYAGPEWSARHREDDREQVAQALCDAFHALLGIQALPPSHVAAHRWRHALASRPLDQDCLFDPDLGLGACGDWCLGARVEAAFLSGAAMAGRVLSNERIVGPQAAGEREGTAQLALL
jgi:predicted NAD/FAD-dependent oxidoreductase